MSFGWSAGDILAAINFILEVAQALDAAGGAAKEFRDASTFLRDVKSALTPLQTLTALGTRPEYKADIELQVKAIKGPIEKFIVDTRGLQNSLGVVKEGHFRHLQNIPSKLKWHFDVSKKVLTLKKEVEQHLQIISTLMQRLTVDMIDALQTNLKSDIEKSLETKLNAHLPMFQTTLLGELSERDSTAQAAWQAQLETLFESYLGPQQTKLPPYLIGEEHETPETNPESISTIYKWSTLKESATHLQTGPGHLVFEQYPYPALGISADSKVTWMIQNWWHSEGSGPICVQCRPSLPAQRSIGSDITALVRETGINVVYHNCQRLDANGEMLNPGDEFVNLIYGIVYQLCNIRQEDFSTSIDMSKARFALLDFTHGSIGYALDLLRDLIFLVRGRCLVVIERMDILDHMDDMKLEAHVELLFGLLQSKSDTGCVKTFVTTEGYSKMVVDCVQEENYVHADVENTDGFIPLAEFQTSLSA